MDNSPLAKLSPELRNKIYELVLTLDKPVLFWGFGGNMSQAFIDPKSAKVCTYVLSLTTLCRAVRTECKRMFFACNTFTMTSFDDILIIESLESLKRLIGEENAMALTKVSFQYGAVCVEKCMVKQIANDLIQQPRFHSTCKVMISICPHSSCVDRPLALDCMRLEESLKSNMQEIDREIASCTDDDKISTLREVADALQRWNDW